MEVIVETNNEEYQRYQRAQKQVEEIKGFYGHLLAFVLANGFMAYINLKYSPQYLWFLWSFLSWGLGLLFHGMKVFKYTPLLGKEWEQRKIKEFMEQEKNRNNEKH